jgi:hypothetical protein
MKDLDQDDADDFVLGKPIRSEKPQAQPVLRQVEGAAKGVMVDADGKFQTEIPLPPTH